MPRCKKTKIVRPPTNLSEDERVAAAWDNSGDPQALVEYLTPQEKTELAAMVNADGTKCDNFNNVFNQWMQKFLDDRKASN